MTRRLVSTISPRLLDLIDIGAYVFAADRITSRGGRTGEGMARAWRRTLDFVIAVRDPQHWSQPETVVLLQETLGFLSEDEFRFVFVASNEEPADSDYFQFTDEPAASGATAPVVLFSGGLDSLAGALEELGSGRRRVILVSHQSSSIVIHHQNELVKELGRRYPNRILHIPVQMTLKGLASTESSQRTRTFLFTCIAGAVAALLEAPGIRFYENGIMSLNLPISPQIVGTSATRSTHPRSLSELSLFLGAAIGRLCSVDNPFVLKTKSEVLQTLARHDGLDLIDQAYTCTEIRRRSGAGTHCGACIQCLHRRFAAFASGLDLHDCGKKYSLDLFEASREGKDLTMLVEMVGRARQFAGMTTIEQFFVLYPLELSRLSSAKSLGSPELAVRSMFDLHRRYGNEVVGVIERGLQTHKQELAKGLMAPASLLTLVVGDQSVSFPAMDKTSRTSKSTKAAHAITLAIDPERGSFAVNGLPPIRSPRGVSVLSLLAEQFHSDISAKRDPARFAYVATAKIVKALAVEENTLRRRIERLRDRIQAALASNEIDIGERDTVIESKSWDGYRLNPSTVRLVNSG